MKFDESRGLSILADIGIFIIFFPVILTAICWAIIDYFKIKIKGFKKGDKCNY